MDNEFWKSIGIIAGTLTAIWGGIIAVIKIQVKAKIDDIQEKYKSFIHEKTLEIEKIAVNNEIKIDKIVSKIRTSYTFVKQEIDHNLDNYTTQIKSYLENSKDSMDRLNDKFDKSMIELDKKFSSIRNELDYVNNKLNEIDIAKIAKKDFIEQLNRLLLNATQFMPESLRPFAILKGRKFINYVMDIRSLDFSHKIDTSVLVAKGVSISEEIKREGYEMINAEFINSYYELHEIKTKDFFKNITNIINEQNNDKKFRFQNECLSFMNVFLQVLDRSYDEHKNKTHS